jgi:phage-related holin
MNAFLTLNYKLNYSITALFKFIGANVWKLIVWTFTIFLLPTYTNIGVIIFLLIIDLITGVWKAIKTKEPVTAKKLGETVSKMILYLFGIVCSFVVQKFIALNAIPIMLIFSMLICVREYKSIIENIEIITGKKIWQFIVTQVTTLLPTDKELNDKGGNK